MNHKETPDFVTMFTDILTILIISKSHVRVIFTETSNDISVVTQSFNLSDKAFLFKVCVQGEYYRRCTLNENVAQWK